MTIEEWYATDLGRKRAILLQLLKIGRLLHQESIAALILVLSVSAKERDGAFVVVVK